MPSYVTPKYGTQFIFYVSLVSQANTKTFQTNPTLAAGDVKISVDGGAEANLTTLPTVTPAGGKRVKVTISSTEMQGDNLTVIFSDVAGAEWCDKKINIQTSARQVDDLAFPTTSGRGIAVDASNKVPATLAAGDLASGSIDVATFTATLMQLLGRRLDLVGVTSLVTADTYSLGGFWNGTVYYKSTTLGTPIYVWWDGAHWNASTVLGTAGAASFQTSGTSVNGTWSHQGTATGTPIATAHGNAVLSSFQPDLAATVSAIWQDATAGDFTVPNSAGAKLAAAGQATGVTADDLLNAMVGSRPAGSLGAFVARIGQVTMTVTSPVLATGDIVIVRGTDCDAADNFSIDLPAPASKWGNLTLATGIVLAAKCKGPVENVVFGPIAGTIINPNTEEQKMRFQPTAEETSVPDANEDGPSYIFEARCIRTTGKKLTPARGGLLVLDNVDA